MTMKKPVLDLLQKKGQDLMEAVQNAEMKLLSYYPPALLRELSVGLVDKDNNSRASYGNDILTWIALVAFRQFTGQNCASDETHHAEDMGYEFMDAIAKAGDHYLSKNELKEFHRLFPMSGKATSAVEAKLAEIKQHAATFGVPLLKNESQLDVNKYPSGYFTCATVRFEDYPWYNSVQDVEMEEEDDED